MGLTDLSSIPSWTAHQYRDRDRAAPIGAKEVHEIVTLTRVSENASGVLNFGDEERGFVLWRARPLEVRAPDTPPSEAVVLLTIELATKDAFYKQQAVSIAMRPYSADWFASSTFKTVTKRPNDHMRDLIDAAARASASKETALWSELIKMKTDPFGNEDTIYARFRLLDRTDTLTEKEYYHRADQLTTSGTKPNRAVDAPKLAFGICQDLENCRKRLEISPLLAGMLETARNGIGRDYRGNDMPLGETAISLAKTVMQAAIMKALAGGGPEDVEDLRRDRRCDAEGSVAVLAGRIFEDDLRNLQRRNSDDLVVRFKAEAEPPFQAKAPLAATQVSRSEIRERVESVRHRIGKGKLLGTEVAIVFHALMQQLDSEGDETPERTARLKDACIYAAAMDASGYELPDHVIQRLEQLREEFPLFVAAAIGAKHESS